MLAALWSRVAFQAENYMPWIMLNQAGTPGSDSKISQASRSLFLDYPSMEYPMRLLAAIRNRHVLVAGSLLVTLFLRVQIMLSTGVFQIVVGAGGSNYLQVTAGNIHTMSAISGLMAILCLFMTYHAPPKTGITPRDPTTIGGTAVLFANSRQLLEKLKGSGTHRSPLLERRLPGSWSAAVKHHAGRNPEFRYQLREISDSTIQSTEEPTADAEGSTPTYWPWKLRPVSLLAISIVAAALVAALWAVYELRGRHDRFRPEPDQYFVYTSLITFIFLLLSSSVGRIDYATRWLTPYWKLATKECRFPEALGLDYTNEFGVVTLFKAFRRQDWVVFTSTCLALSAWLMPIFTAGLFAVSSMGRGEDVKLQKESYFATGSASGQLSPNPSLVNNIFISDHASYPAWTYQNLVFPSLSMQFQEPEWSESAMLVMATVPAVTAELSCQITALAQGSGRDLTCTTFDSDFSGMDECKDQDYIGFAASSCSQLPSNSTFNYIWGSCSSTGTINALMCSERIQQVQVQTTFVGKKLAVSTDQIPIPNTESEKSVKIYLSASGAYDLLRGIQPATDTSGSLDDFFTTLVQSQLGVPTEGLTTQVRTNSVLQAIKAQHSIVRAQVLSSNAIRHSYSSSSQRPSPLAGSYEYFSPRLAQSPPQTYALTALLGLALLLSIVLALLLPRCVLPKNPGSVAARASLWADSTLWWHLPPGAEWLPDEKLAHRLRRKTFRMGWFDGAGGRKETLGRNFTIGVVQDDGRLEVVELEGDIAMVQRL